MLKWSAIVRCLAGVSMAASVGTLGCEGNKTPQPAANTSATAAVQASASPIASATNAASPEVTAAPKLPEREIAGAAQILVTWKGAELAEKAVTRSKADAKKRADEALAKVKKDNMAFEEAAKKFSDHEASKNIGGAIGNFEKNAMPEAFSKATFAMKVGEISDVVETPRGYHIIKRTR